MDNSQSAQEYRELFGEGPVWPEEPRKRRFSPWHNPRKQYIRREQWVKALSELIDDYMKTGRRDFQYLTLPGEDLLDVRYFHNTVFAPQEILFKYIGFDTARNNSAEREARLGADQHATRLELEYIDHESRVIPGDIRRIAQENSYEYLSFLAAAPFDAINLDLCKGIASKDKDEGIPNYFDTLSGIMAVQSHSDHDFLLFITTRMDDGPIEPDKRAALHRVVEDVCEECSIFRDELSKYWNIDLCDPCRSLASEDCEGSVFALSIALWILCHGLNAGLRGNVLDFITYKVYGKNEEDDMLSLAIRFSQSPHQPIDKYELCSGGQVAFTAPDKCDLASLVPEKIYRKLSLDSYIEANRDVWEWCVNESADLLASAGYDKEGYLKWAESRRMSDI